jgi:gas vesicle protein
MANDAAGYLGWFLFGAAIGAAAALLTTPRTGAETRDLLGEKARDLLGEHGGDLARRAQSLAGEAQGRAGDWLEKGRELFEEQAQRLMNAFEAGKEAMRDEIRRGSPEPHA